MSAECSTCGTDLVYGAEYPDMFCQVCTLREDRDRARETNQRLNRRIGGLERELRVAEHTAQNLRDNCPYRRRLLELGETLEGAER